MFQLLPTVSLPRKFVCRLVSKCHLNLNLDWRSSRDVRTPERGRSTDMKAAKRSRLPVAVKSHVELRARARYARQEKLVRDNKAVSTSRIPRAVQSPHRRHQTASLDRRYTKSTEVLASKPDDVTSTEPSVPAAAVPEQLETEDSFQQKEDSCSTRRKSISSTTSRQRFVQRSRTIEDRHRSSCCGRMAAAAASTSSSRGERRRASLDATSPSSHTRRRCQRCRDKGSCLHQFLWDLRHSVTTRRAESRGIIDRDRSNSQEGPLWFKNITHPQTHTSEWVGRSFLEGACNACYPTGHDRPIKRK